MKILILNRRDIRNPQGGGAEIYTHEIAKGLSSRGAEVTVFSYRFAGAARNEETDGVWYTRRGNEATVHLWGFLHAFQHRKKYDLIIDQFNGVGFFCFLIPGIRKMLLIHQLYREFWLRELGVFGVLPYLLEPSLLRCYRRMPVVTVSDSTKGDLQHLGFRDVKVVMNALSNPPLESPGEKEDRPTLLFLGRLRSTKRPEDAVRIFEKVRNEMPEAQLWFAGTGPEEEKLKGETRELEGVAFFGWASEEKKFQLLRRAHILVVPGVREGFGINVIEAASQGTPAVGYNVHGLRDSIRDGDTGFLANGPEDAAQKAIRLLKNPAMYGKMASRCLEYSAQFNWQRRAEEFWQLIGNSDRKPTV